MLKQPDERTKAAFRRLRSDTDFIQILDWLEHSIAELDQTKRMTIPEPLLRQQQGACQAVAEIVKEARQPATAKATLDHGPVAYYRA